jgi:hypothetical protein
MMTVYSNLSADCSQEFVKQESFVSYDRLNSWFTPRIKILTLQLCANFSLYESKDARQRAKVEVMSYKPECCQHAAVMVYKRRTMTKRYIIYGARHDTTTISSLTRTRGRGESVSCW